MPTKKDTSDGACHYLHILIASIGVIKQQES